MARFNRRGFRRNRGFWFPVPGAPALVQLAALAAGTTNVVGDDILGGALDDPLDTTADPAARLNDYGRQGYFIKRVVGQAFIWVTGTYTGDPVLVTLSIGQARVDDTGVVVDAASYNHFTNVFLSRVQKRYIWQRTWALNANNVIGGTTNPVFPPSNTQGRGSVREGCFIDTKGTSLRVEPFHKAYVFLAAFNTSGQPVDVNLRHKLRAFGSGNLTRERAG